MQSAFGIDHGEISKIRWGAPRRPKIPKMKGAPGGAKPSAAQKRTAGTNPDALTRPAKIKGALNRAGEADISLKGIGSGAGRVIRGTGGFLEKRPGLTGTALVGGGGAAGYKYLSEKQPRKKR